MVRIYTLIGTVALVAAAPAAAQTVMPNALQTGETLLQVQAQGRAFYNPDMATISVGVVSTGTTARAATDANAKTMADVIAAVRRAGVEARYVRTQQINVQPRFARNSPMDYEGQAQITGYVARNTVSVTVTKLGIAPDVVAAAFGAGANSVNGPNLASSNLEAGVSEARSQAVTNARAEAEDYAKAFGLRVVRVLRIGERGTQVENGDIVVTAMRVAAHHHHRRHPPPPIEGGEMARTLTLWVDFALSK